MRGSLRRRDRRKERSGPDRWELRVFLGRDDHGKVKQATRAFAGSKREAESALAAFVTEVEKGRRNKSSRMLFRDFANAWIKSRSTDGELAIKTLERYEGIIRDHLLPYLGDISLAAISAKSIRAALTGWQSGKRLDRKAGTLSTKSVSHHFALLRQIFSDAVRERLLLDNPVNFVRAPRTAGSRRRTYTMGQIIALEDSLVGSLLATPVHVKALTGLRRGELLALRWSQIDLQLGIAEIQQSLTRDRHGRLYFKRPKTEKSQRVIALAPTVVEALRNHYSMQCETNRRLGLERPNDLVFCEPDGSPWDPDKFSSAFAYHISRSNLAPISLQELRHSYSSISTRLGTPIPTTSQSMGHSNTIITSDVYTHAILEDLHAAAHRIEIAYFKARTELEAK